MQSEESEGLGMTYRNIKPTKTPMIQCPKCNHWFENGMRVTIICPVRKGTPEAVFHHVVKLEKEGNKVFFPARDIPKVMPEGEICQKMQHEMAVAKEVHVWYSPDSQGVHFDMGVLFTLLAWSVFRPKVKWLNPSNPTGLDGYEVVLKGMCE